MATSLSTSATMILTKTYQPGATYTGSKGIAVSLPSATYSLSNTSNDVDYNARLTIGGTASIDLTSRTDIYGNSVDINELVTLAFDTRYTNTGKSAANSAAISLTVEDSGSTNLVLIPCQPESTGIIVFPDGLASVDHIDVTGTSADVIDVYLTGLAT